MPRKRKDYFKKHYGTRLKINIMLLLYVIYAFAWLRHALGHAGVNSVTESEEMV